MAYIQSWTYRPPLYHPVAPPVLPGGRSSVKRLLWVGKSRIAGKGLFTAQDIKKGTRILQYIKRLASMRK